MINGHIHHLQHDNKNNDIRRLEAATVLCAWGGKREQEKLTATLSISYIFLFFLCLPPRPYGGYQLPEMITFMPISLYGRHGLSFLKTFSLFCLGDIFLNLTSHSSISTNTCNP